MREHAAHLPYTAQLHGLVTAAKGRTDDALAMFATIDETTIDGHHTFHLAESYAMAGANDRAVALFDRAVTMGSYPADYFARLNPSAASLVSVRTLRRCSHGRGAEFTAAVG